jgi:hypothetical protein
MPKFSAKAKKILASGQGVYYSKGRAMAAPKRFVSATRKKARRVPGKSKVDRARRAKTLLTFSAWKKSPRSADLIVRRTIGGKKRRVFVSGR